MATETNTTVNEPTTQNEPTTPTVEQLMEELATVKADAERYKTANDKLSKSEAEMKRQLRAKQTAEEQEAEAKAEAERLANEERESLKAELNQIKAENAYKGRISEDAVQKLVDAVSNANHIAIAELITKECEKAVAKEKQIWLEGRPQVNYGGADASPITKEKILAIKDTTERQRAIAENIDLFY